MTKLGVLMGHRHCSKHLVPQKIKPKTIFLKIQKLMDPPGNLVLLTGTGGEREKRTSVPFLPAVGPEPSQRHTGRPAEARVRTGRHLKGEVGCWLMDVLSHQSLPTSTAMAEVIDRFLSKLTGYSAGDVDGNSAPTANRDPPALARLGSAWGSGIGEPAAVRSASLAVRTGARHSATLPTPEGTCWLRTPGTDVGRALLRAPLAPDMESWHSDGYGLVDQ